MFIITENSEKRKTFTNGQRAEECFIRTDLLGFAKPLMYYHDKKY